MRIRNVIGKRIVAVRQTQKSLGVGRGVDYYLDYIELEDGTRIVVSVHEGDNDYGVSTTAVRAS